MEDIEIIIKPRINDSEARQILSNDFGLDICEMKKLDGYDDLNFYFTLKNEPRMDNHDIWPHGYVLKIINWRESMNEEFFREYTNVLVHLNREKFPCPHPIPNKRGEYLSHWIDSNGRSKDFKHLIFVLTYLPGEVLENISYNEEIDFTIGRLMKELHTKLQKFKNSLALRRSDFPWSLSSAADIVDKELHVIEDLEKRSLVEKSCKEFRWIVLDNIDKLEKGVIHGDLNLTNILVQKRDSDVNFYDVVGIIDFADLNNSCYIFDVAITACYVSLPNVTRCEDAIARLLAGYEKKLSDFEMQALKICMCMRVCQALVIGTQTLLSHPENDYIRNANSMKYGWALLKKLSGISYSVFGPLIQNKIDAVLCNIREKSEK